MLKPSQILASEWAVLSLDKVMAVLPGIYAQQPERLQQAIEALHFFDAFLSVTDASNNHLFSPRVLLGFRGFLAAEVDLPTADALKIVWAVGDWLLTGGLISEQGVQFALSQDETCAMRLYQEATPIPDRIKYYSEWFVIRGGSLAIDLSCLDLTLSEQSQQFLRDKLADYLRDKDAYQARKDVELIHSLLLGYTRRWPARELSSPLTTKETAMFIMLIKTAARGQALSRNEANQNVRFFMKVVRQFFMRSGIFATVGRV